MAASVIGGHVRGADALVIVPPFAGLDRPALGAHVLQACARDQGFVVKVLYANVLLARTIGEREYSSICFASTSSLLGERFFSGSAYGEWAEERPAEIRRLPAELSSARFYELAEIAADWCDGVARDVAAETIAVVGSTSTFEQTAASIALLDRVKTLQPDVVTIMGGANCEGAMAQGILSLTSSVDHVFSSESERTFPEFLRATLRDRSPSPRVIHGEICRDMDGVPTPDFTEFYAQLEEFLPASEVARTGSIWLPYESSRGCWWGEKSHCTFCGINGGGMAFRRKSEDRVIAELKSLASAHPTNLVCMVDNIMPHEYFRTLLPRLAEEAPGLHLFYEQKANLTLEKVALLKRAGVAVIQPGIEALSTPLLKLMRKGVKAHQNVALLRYARSVDLAVNWNLLYAFPGDEVAWYRDTLELMPLLAHLNPPTGLCHLSIDRFSPYFEQPNAFGISDVRPMQAYSEVLPPDADHQSVAYHFQGTYPSGSRDDGELVEALQAGIATWRSSWESTDEPLPALDVAELGDGVFLLADTRGIPGLPEFEFIDAHQARVALTGEVDGSGSRERAWALDRRVCVELDERVVPLATAAPEVLASSSSKASAARRAPAPPAPPRTVVEAP